MRSLLKRIFIALAGIATAVVLIVSAFRSGRRRGRANAVQTAAEAAAKKKEAEIEKTDASDLVAGSDRSDEYRRRKKQLVDDFNQRTENLL